MLASEDTLRWHPPGTCLQIICLRAAHAASSSLCSPPAVLTAFLTLSYCPFVPCPQRLKGERRQPWWLPEGLFQEQGREPFPGDCRRGGPVRSQVWHDILCSLYPGFLEKHPIPHKDLHQGKKYARVPSLSPPTHTHTS